MPELELLLLQVPPVVALASVTLLPTHTVPGPVIAAGSAFTVTTRDAIQPDDKV
jgi:hypothetical protein